MLTSLDALSLARAQFAFTLVFHIVYPAFSIGLASYLLVLESLWLATGRAVFLDLFRYWIRIFAVAFGMGVVSGLVMSYQFGTNWSVFSDKAGPVVGPLMGYEVLSAFFLEAGFLGVMLFGMNRVGKGLHMLATAMVAGGTLFSAFWIISVNSWMQTPDGFGINASGQFVPQDWWKIVFNPSFPYRLVHMVLAAYLTTAFAVGAVGAWHLLKNQHSEAARVMFSMAMWMAVAVAPLQIAAGDFHGLNTLKHQPAKIAAMEGDFETQKGAPLILFGIPDMDNEVTNYRLEIPRLGSLILTHDWNGEISGLKDFPRDKRPNAAIVFFSFRLMVGIGFAMLGLGLWSLVQRWRGALHESPWLHRAAVLMGPFGFVAVVSGWITTEVGRQPYTVYGHLTTAESVSPLSAAAVEGSLIAFVVIYFAVFGAGLFYILRLMAAAPGPHTQGVENSGPIRAAGITPAAALDPNRAVAAAQ